MSTCTFCQNALDLQVFDKITYLPVITNLTITQKKKKKSIIELILYYLWINLLNLQFLHPLGIAQGLHTA